MKTIKEIQEKQKKLNKQIVPCPNCGEKEEWEVIMEYGECNKCFDKHQLPLKSKP